MSGILTHHPKDIPERLRSGGFKIAVVGYGGSETPLAYAYGRIGAHVSIVDIDVCSTEMFIKMIAGSRYALAISRLVRSGGLRIASNRIEAIAEADIIDIFAPVALSGLGRPDYSILHRLSEEVGRGLSEGKLVISSTITPPGITEDVIADVLEKSSGLKAGYNFGLAYSPYEPLQVEKSDSTIKILAATDKRSLDIAEAIVDTVYGCRILKVDGIRCAEAIKLFDIASKYILYAFTYELLRVCDKIGLDRSSLNYTMESIYPYLYQLLPVWMHFSDNAKLLMDLCETYKLKPRILYAALKVGEDIPGIYISMIREAAKRIDKPLRRCRVSLIGLPGKACIGYSVDNPLLTILASRLRRMGVSVKIFDPYGSGGGLDKLGVKVSRRIEECLEDTDIILILPESRSMKTAITRKLGIAKALTQTTPVIIDLAGVIDRIEASKLGFIYLGLDGAPSWEIG
ncbi:MAG: hypothetical protein QW374_02850 [Candidatus Bathyarchaeia archaeon]|nr:hypothetical protein [Candidatus Bathyarchaeota archaeon]